MIIGDDRIGLLDGVKSSDCSNKKITGKVRLAILSNHFLLPSFFLGYLEMEYDFLFFPREALDF